MKLNKYIFPALMGMALAGCSDDDLGPTIFPEVSDDADPSSYTYKFDTWLNQNFRDVYNLDFKYKLEDVEADMNYNLVPAKLDNAQDICVLTKYLWFDAYAEHCGQDFIKQYGPRILHLIGSPAYNVNSGTETLGLAEGGLKVTLFKVNQMDVTNINQMNEYYFRTMHHEFAHILHQTKSYPTDFNLLSNGRYDDSSWQSKDIGYVASLGFITPYASSQYREDFAETIANYMVRTDDALELIMWMAQQGWTTGDDSDELNENGDPYYCYYYISETDANTRVYFLSSVEKDSSYRVAMLTDGGIYLHSVAEVEDYLETMKTKHGEIYPVDDKDGVDGYDIIQQKQRIARSWFKDTWSLDLDDLRNIVLRRQQDFDIQALRAEIDAIQ